MVPLHQHSSSMDHPGAQNHQRLPALVSLLLSATRVVVLMSAQWVAYVGVCRIYLVTRAW